MSGSRTVKLPFFERFREPMLAGVKVCTLRRDSRVKVWDRFETFGHVFEVTEVQMATPDFVGRGFWKEEGCTSEDDFKAVWKKIHPRLSTEKYCRWIWFRRVSP